MKNIITELKNQKSNESYTENGMRGYKSTYHPLADMNFRLPSYREDKKKLLDDLEKVIKSEDSKYLLKYLFFLRDVREGLGERESFKIALKELVNKYNFENKDEIINKIISTDIVEYGRYDDLLVLLGTLYEPIVINTLKEQLSKDYDNMKASKPISLLAKWMPSINTSSKQTRKLANKIIEAFKCSPREYRRMLSSLRKYLNIVEVNASSNKWENIDYNQVPSNANIKYSDAFLKHDEERRRDYLAALRIGKDKDGNEVKINSSVNFPHQIVSKYNYSKYDEALEQMWKALPQKEGLEGTIVVRDGSGSMTWSGFSNVSPLDVATSLAIYCSERLKGEYKDNFITFSRNPKLISLNDCNNLCKKLEYIRRFNECENTDIAKVFDLLLRTAQNSNLTEEEMPKQILIISDMEFDECADNATNNAFEIAARNYEAAGYKLPKVVFWNVASITNTIPMKTNENGIVLVSGFSVNILDMVMSGKTEPFEILTEKLDCKRYENIPYLTIEKKNDTKQVQFEKPNWL